MDTPIFNEPADLLGHDAFVAPASLTLQAVRQPAKTPQDVQARRVEAGRIRRLRQQVQFLAAYAEHGVVTAAAKASGVNRQTALGWARDDEGFEALMRDAYESARDGAEHEVVRRAVHGVDKSIYYKGKKIDTVKEYSDTLLALLIKQRRPSFAATDKPGSGQTTNVSVSHTLVVPIERLNDEQFRLLEQIYGKAGPPVIDVPASGQKALTPDSEG